MAKELGDVLWYVAQLASELGLDLDEIAQVNLDKLLSRQRGGVLSGSGDERLAPDRRALRHAYPRAFQMISQRCPSRSRK
jgi:MazG nucleotide pyrophosphohydrolase domain